MRFPKDDKIVTAIMNPGDIHYCPPASWKEPIWNHFHSMSSLLFTKNMIRITFINYNMSSNYYQDHGANIFYHTSKPVTEAGCHILQALELFGGKSEYLALSKDLIKVLMNLALEAVCEDSNQVPTKRQFTFYRIKNYLSENFHLGITREQTARIFGLNPSYLSRLFREESGESFHDALLRIRMEYAVFLLKNTDYNIGEITQKCGYSSSTFFSSVFKSCYNMPPGKYRRC